MGDRFSCRDDVRCAEEVPVPRIAAAVATPFCRYSAGGFVWRCRAFVAIAAAGARFAVVRARPSYHALLSLHSIPDWLEHPPRPPAAQRDAR